MNNFTESQESFVRENEILLIFFTKNQTFVHKPQTFVCARGCVGGCGCGCVSVCVPERGIQAFERWPSGERSRVRQD
jgi:hypothetical protein